MVVDSNKDISGGRNLTVTGVVTANAGVVVDNITIDGTEIDLSSGDLTIDVAGDIILDADGGEVFFKDGGTSTGKVRMDDGDLQIRSLVSDKDITLEGNDGGSIIEAMRLDMSAAGHATLNNGLTLTDGNLVVASGHGIDFSATGDASGASSELLSNYEIGTWSPTIFGGSTAGSYTLESARTGGKYIRTGNHVFVSAVLRISNIASAGAGTLNFGGLPYAFGSNLANSWSEGGGLTVSHYGAGAQSSADTYPPPFTGIGGSGNSTVTMNSFGKNYQVSSVIGDLSANNWIYIISGSYVCA